MSDKQGRKKLLIVSQHFWPESFRINDIADYLNTYQNCDIDVLCGIPNYPSGKFADGYSFIKNRRQRHNGMNIIRSYEIPRGNNTNIRIFVNYVSFPITSVFHIPRLMFNKYDRIFLYQLSPVMMTFAGILLGKIKNVKTIMYVLDLWPENLYSVLNIKSKFLRKIIRYISHWHYRNADKLIALSSLMKQRLEDATKNQNKDIVVIPQTCEKIYEETIYDENLHKRFDKTFNVVYTGNISPAQSFDTMIKAADILKNEGLDNIKWIIVGDGMSRKHIQKKASDLNLLDTFIFEGQKPMEDIPRYADITDVFVGCLVKSDLLEATIPAKVMSYIAAGKPMVLAMDGEVQELINNRIKCGFAGPTEDSEKLAKNIMSLYKMSGKQRDMMGKRARSYYFKYFERDLVLARLSSFIFS